MGNSLKAMKPNSECKYNNFVTEFNKRGKESCVRLAGNAA